jgi:Zn-dependent protease
MYGTSPMLSFNIIKPLFIKVSKGVFLKICRIFGISVELHSSFVWLAVIIVMLLFLTMPGSLLPVTSVLVLLFLTVFVHEFFHSVVAIAKGVKVKKIILLPIGGLSMAESIPEKPSDEFVIAIAGPLFNFLMVIAIAVLVRLFPVLPWPSEILASELTVEKLNFAIMNYPLFALFWVNFILGAFNLFLPALPLDGGRVFRALLASRTSFIRATKIATTVSSFIAIALFILGFLMADLIIIIIAAFIYLGAFQEKEMAVLKEVAKGLSIREIVNRKPIIIDGSLSVEETAELMKEKKQTAFLVARGRSYSVISSKEVTEAEKKGYEGKISAICIKQPLIPVEKKDEIMAAIFAKGLPIVGVSEKGRLAGTISETEINKMYALSKLDTEK